MPRKPHVLPGETGTRRIIAELEKRGWGRMYVGKTPAPFPGERCILVWAVGVDYRWIVAEGNEIWPPKPPAAQPK